MKKTIAIALMALSSLTTLAQESTALVEKSIFNVQPGFLGVYINNESRLGNKWALRTEAGLDAAFSANGNTSDVWGLMPAINLEPRYYYNISKRAAKGKRTSKNSANFATVSLRYSPDWFILSNKDHIITENTVYIIPKWGIRRTIGNSGFNYEAGIGIGYYSIFGNDRKYYADPEGVALDLHLRLGYCF
ncbi:hypothetical protein [Flavobacterium psychrotrophum]|uniref:hypothetical protein n=1 Tax=Flavobacterium psychrotrophum TaxID=2294119 RepID=UPI000E316C3C|nr:hypothetical protein [Flavobacterium psychrotrophum]